MTATIERVVVPLDAASENDTAIDTAARLAARWKSRLHGVFIEDEDLLHLAGMPFARQVTLGVGVETFTPQQAERQMRAFAEKSRRDLAATAARYGVESSFEIVRGAASGESFTNAESDFVVAGALTRPIGAHFRLDCRWWSAIEMVPSAFLLARQNWAHAGSVVILLGDREAGSVRLIEAAARSAEAAGGGLTVVCAPDLTHSVGFEAWLAERLAPYSVRVQIELMPSDAATLIERIVELNCQLVAIEAGTAAAQPDRLREMVARVSCDVLVVR